MDMWNFDSRILVIIASVTREAATPTFKNTILIAFSPFVYKFNLFVLTSTKLSYSSSHAFRSFILSWLTFSIACIFLYIKKMEQKSQGIYILELLTEAGDVDFEWYDMRLQETNT